MALSAAAARRASLAGLAASFGVVPLALLAVTSLGRSWFWPAIVPPEWSLRAWRYLALPEAGVMEATATSLAIAATVSAIAIVLALPAARALATLDGPWRRLLTFALLLPVLAPPLAAAMGLHGVFLRLGIVDSLSAVVLVHLVPAVPYATLMLAGSFANLDADWEAQARTLGASRRRVWTLVILPAIAPGLAVAAAFAFLISWSQYLLTLLIGGGHVVTLPLALVSFVRSGDETVGAAVSLVLVAPTLVVFGLVARHLKEW